MENFEKKDRQLENLENLVEKHTRTQRHLEQYSQIGDPQNKENARKIQTVREKEIENLENKIKGKEQFISPEEHLENLKENYENTQGYIQNNKDSIDVQMLKDLQEKQQNREEQINFLENEE